MNELPPGEAITLCKNHGCQGIAWTYNEPTIWHEYTLDSAKLAKKTGLYTVYVTNGYINEDPLRELSQFLDAMNIDVKAFHDNFYKKICKAKRQPVLDTCILAKEIGIHIELTYLVIPTLNDSLEEISEFCSWVVDELGEDIPIHFSRFHPDYHLMDKPPTSIESLKKIYDTAKKLGVRYPYLGNVPHGDYENTWCPQCHALLIERNGFSPQMKKLTNGICTQCGTPIPHILL
jgi:pyruvate formate lyase activating enzyme